MFNIPENFASISKVEGPHISCTVKLAKPARPRPPFNNKIDALQITVKK